MYLVGLNRAETAHYQLTVLCVMYIRNCSHSIHYVVSVYLTCQGREVWLQTPPPPGDCLLTSSSHEPSMTVPPDVDTHREKEGGRGGRGGGRGEREGGGKVGREEEGRRDERGGGKGGGKAYRIE